MFINAYNKHLIHVLSPYRNSPSGEQVLFKTKAETKQKCNELLFVRCHFVLISIFHTVYLRRAVRLYPNKKEFKVW